MYPGKLLSLANKGWGWAPLLKHVGFEWKKVSYMLKKRERITRKVVRILEQLKWRSKDRKFRRNSKSWRYQKSTNKVVNSKKLKIKCQRSEEFQRAPMWYHKL